MWNTKNPKIRARKKLIMVRKLKLFITEILAGITLVATLTVFTVLIYILG